MSSSSRNTTTKTTVVTGTPFCKVCRDAGKPEKEYTSHYVKDQPGPDGKVVCPTLLNQACRICHQTGHTSSYCSQYRQRVVRRDDDYYKNEREREREREEEIAPRRRSSSYYYESLREDTERRDRETHERDEVYHREQDRRSRPWLQVAMKPPAYAAATAVCVPRHTTSTDHRELMRESEDRQNNYRHKPYAHPHGPRVRLNLETTALCASKHATAATTAVTNNNNNNRQQPNVTVTEEASATKPAIDVRKINIKHASRWGDEDVEEPFTCDPQEMTREFFQDVVMSNVTSSSEHNFIEACDDQSQFPFFCGE